jgi:uncharacterized iron-regulated membrane protein
MKITNRKLFTLHSWLGLLAGIFVLAISLSGAFISLSKQYDCFVHSEIVLVTKQDNPIVYDSIIRNAKKVLPDFKLYDFIRIPQSDDEAVELLYFPDDSYHSAFFNPYTGKFLGKLEYNLSRTLIKFHWSFFAGNIGALAALLCGLSVMASVITGIVIYKKHIWQALLFKVKWKRNKGGLSFSSLHRVWGVYSLLFMLILFGTGAFINYEILSGDFTYPEGEQLNQPPKFILSVSLDALIAYVKIKEPSFHPTYISFPQLTGGHIVIGGKFKSDNVWSSKSSSFEFDEHTGKPLAFNDGRTLQAADQTKSIIYNLHYATFGGVWLKILYCTFGILSGLMPITGFILWVKRK